MNGLLLFLPLLGALLLVSCTGVFINPDLAHGNNPSSSLTHRVKLPGIDPGTRAQLMANGDTRLRERVDTLYYPGEDRIYRSLKDTGFSRIPERDYYAMQEFMLNLAARTARTDLPFVAFADTAVGKDITRIHDRDNPSISPLRYLESMANEGVSVYELKDCPVTLLCAYLKSGLPVISYGTVIIKKKLQGKKQGTEADTLFPASPSLQGDQSRRLFRKYTSFDLIYGYSKLNGPSRRYSGEAEIDYLKQGDAYLFETRSRLNFTAKSNNPVFNMALPLYGGVPAGSTWLFTNLYVMVPKGKTAEEIADRVKPAAVQAGFTSALPLPEKLF